MKKMVIALAVIAAAMTSTATLAQNVDVAGNCTQIAFEKTRVMPYNRADALQANQYFTNACLMGYQTATTSPAAIGVRRGEMKDSIASARNAGKPALTITFLNTMLDMFNLGVQMGGAR